jgi:hypothetical protein
MFQNSWVSLLRLSVTKEAIRINGKKGRAGVPDAIPNPAAAHNDAWGLTFWDPGLINNQ